MCIYLYFFLLFVLVILYYKYCFLFIAIAIYYLPSVLFFAVVCCCNPVNVHCVGQIKDYLILSFLEPQTQGEKKTSFFFGQNCAQIFPSLIFVKATMAEIIALTYLASVSTDFSLSFFSVGPLQLFIMMPQSLYFVWH